MTKGSISRWLCDCLLSPIVDKEPELASQFRIISIPTLVVMQDGQVVAQAVGARPKSAILAML